MSVVNQMLSALDARRAEPPPVAGEVSLAVPQARRWGALRSRRYQSMALVGAAVVSAAALGNWPAWTGKPAHVPTPVAMSEVPPVAPAAASAAALPVSPMEVGAPDAVASAPGVSPPAMAAAPVAPAPAAAEAKAKPAKAPSPNEVAPALPADGALALQVERVLTTPVRPAAAPSGVPATSTVAMSSPEGSAARPATEGAVEKKLIALSPAQRAAVAYRQASELAATGYSSQAIDKALETLSHDPSHAAARQLAAVLMFESNRLESAGALLQEGLAREPRHPQFAYLLARLKVESGGADEALALLAPPIPLTAEGHGLRAGLLTQKGRYREAQSAYQAALRLAPDNASWWLGLGVSLDADGQAASARQAFQRARAIGTLRGDVTAYLDQKLSSLSEPTVTALTESRGTP